MLAEAGAGLAMWAAVWAAAPTFDYDRGAPLDLQASSAQERADAVVRNISFRRLAGGRGPWRNESLRARSSNSKIGN
jgi:hypothetical protein